MTNNESNEDKIARKLIEEAFEDVNLDVDGTPCPLGEDCSMHYRVDESTIDEDLQYGRLISYVGEYAVITADNPEFENPVLLLKILTGAIEEKDLPPLYETCVIRVGDGAIADLRKESARQQWESIRFVETHNSWEGFKSAHELVVSGVVGGEIDLSKPALPEED